MRRMIFFITMMALAMSLVGSITAESALHTESLSEVVRLRLELEADRMLFAPNFHIGDSLLIEGEILEVQAGWIEIEQHLDSPPHPIEPRVNVHSQTLVQIRTVDSSFELLDVKNSFTGTETLKKGDIISILYLPHNKMAKSIVIFRNEN